ncbi:MAG: hypothetical protein HC787_02330 [Nostocaceae cyanobacterium CSU_2_110]|nr:hypothetical protein [Nostocaceae cyanobacterium CSU_2_110]
MLRASVNSLSLINNINIVPFTSKLTMMKLIKLATLGLFAASVTFTLTPEARASVKTTANQSLPLISRRVRAIRRRYPVYRKRRSYRTHRYRKCTYKIRYYRGVRQRYRLCNYYRR